MKHLKKICYVIIVIASINSTLSHTKKINLPKKRASSLREKNTENLPNNNDPLKKISYARPSDHQTITYRMIKIANNITNNMLKYRWGWSDYEPTSFYLTINDTMLNNGEEKYIEIEHNNIIEVTYHYEFESGLVKGSKTIEVEIPENESCLNLSFSWKNNLRIIPNVGQPIRCKNSVLKSTYGLS